MIAHAEIADALNAGMIRDRLVGGAGITVRDAEAPVYQAFRQLVLACRRYRDGP